MSFNRVMAVAVHPDDETLGCGGTLLKLRQQGARLGWCIVTDTREVPSFSREFFENREREIERVAESYSFEQVIRCGFPSTQLDQADLGLMIGKIGAAIDQFKPDTVFLPFAYDVHTDHQRVFQACWSALKTFKRQGVKRIYMMETLSETDQSLPLAQCTFVPNSYFEIGAHLESKCEIMQIYKSEIKPHPFPRSLEAIRALARLRGATAGMTAAEAFMLVREIN